MTKVLENDPAGSGQLTLETDYAYDALNDLTSVNQKGASGDTPRARSFVYDGLSRLTSASNPETGTTSYSYTSTGGGLCSGDPSNVCSRTDARGVVTNYSYDALNRLAGKSYQNDPANTPTLAYTYDTQLPDQIWENENNGIGHVTQIQANVGTTVLDTWVSLDYDQMGRPMGYSDCVGSTAANCLTATAAAPGPGTYTDYNLDGTIYDEGIEDCSTNCNPFMFLQYGYDGAGRLNLIEPSIYLDSSDNNLQTDAFTAPVYNALGQITSVNLGVVPGSTAPIALSRSYDNRGRLTGEIDANPQMQSVYNYSVGYDGNNNVNGFNDSVTGNWTITNDSLHRLVGGVGSGAIAGESFQETYDHFGNRNGESISAEGADTQPYPYLNFNANNQVTQFAMYDAAGNVTEDQNNQYLYDGEGRLCAVQPVGGGGGTFCYYEAAGKRLGKAAITGTFTCDVTQNGLVATNTYAYGAGGEEMEETDGNFNMLHFNAFLNGRLLGTFAGTTYSPANWEYALNDWVGTKRVIANYDGSFSVAFGSGPFGDFLTSSGSGSDPSEQHFTGKERDSESGNDFFGARYYASSMGRFLSPDWIDVQWGPVPVPGADFDNPQSLNQYGYVNNNPLTNTDPDGHSVNVCSTDSSGNQQCTLMSNDQYQAAQQGNGSLNVPTLDQVGDNSTNGTFNATAITDANGNTVGTATYVPDNPGIDPYVGNNMAGYQQLAAANKVVTYSAVGTAVAFGGVAAAMAAPEVAAAIGRNGIRFSLDHGMRWAADHTMVMATASEVKEAVGAAITSGAISMGSNGVFSGQTMVNGTIIGFTGRVLSTGEVVVSNVFGGFTK